MWIYLTNIYRSMSDDDDDDDGDNDSEMTLMILIITMKTALTQTSFINNDDNGDIIDNTAQVNSVIVIDVNLTTTHHHHHPRSKVMSWVGSASSLHGC